MSNYDNTNRGQIWPNDRKESEKHPDFKGGLNVEGVEYWVSAWKRGSDANPKAPSLRFSIQKKEDSKRSQAVQQAPHSESLDDQIPF